jgi:hypothetical protein
MYSKIAERSWARVAQPPGGGSCRSLSLVRVAKNVSATALAFAFDCARSAG